MSGSDPNPGSTGDGQRHERPPVFADLTLADARRGAAEQTKLLVVDVTGRGCVPCRLMDRTTWRDERVAGWIAEHAVAVQLDADVDPDSIRGLGIWALPTVIIYSGETEIARLRGYRDAPALLKQLERAQHKAAGRAARDDG